MITTVTVWKLDDIRGIKIGLAVEWILKNLTRLFKISIS